ncbi:MAG: hypothetical protein ACNFW9_03560 [Candidatus Kerfeldbacteria bacterium]|jgi:hypothetical protein
MKQETKKKLYKFLAIGTLILSLIAFIIYAIYRFFKFVTSGTLEGTLWGIGVIIVPILLFILISRIRGELYQQERAKINQQRKEREEKLEREERKRKAEAEAREKSEREERKRKAEAEAKEAKRRGICVCCEKPSKNLDSLAWCNNCILEVERIKRKRKEKPLRDAEEAGKDVCWECESINPNRFRTGECIQCSNRCRCGAPFTRHNPSLGGECVDCFLDYDD